MGQRGIPLAAAAGALLHTTQLASPNGSDTTCLPGGVHASSNICAAVTNVLLSLQGSAVGSKSEATLEPQTA